ncbi:DNA-directed DNA polymerase [Ranunculus cassubicifolius]
MESSPPDPSVFSIRIVSIDYYMAPPIPNLDVCYSTFQGEKVNEVPVIRVYGSTPAGQKTCLHLHKALPYLYVPCSEILQTSEEADRYIRDISSAIEKALKSKMKSSSGAKRQHVHGCSLVRARKFYGFHPAEELFVKINLYYPHEVARVATLLLDGAVLERSYQPHESHIPYLLQFLVDYNLYGMGHLHVSKVKFRYPLPAGFIPRATHRSRARGDDTAKLASSYTHDEADSSTNPCLGLPVWTSSTVPSSWMWPPPVTTNSLPDQDVCLLKRQSICELEGDANVDEIVNQQLKMYTPLSQTRSEVKMVQSLVPIWQEEYERTGMHDEVIYSEPSKPLPGNVLKTLSHGPECENALMDLCREVEKSPSQVTPTQEAERFLQSIRSLADVGTICEIDEDMKLNFSSEGSFQCSEEKLGSGSVPPEESLSKQYVHPESSELGHIFQGKEQVDEDMGSLKKLVTSDPEGIDTEAMGLLKWLASSQAEEDLNTDDELGYDLVLTPLLPKTAIGKILEKANLDYECESQQECQDILDSVVDTNTYVLKHQDLHSTSEDPSTSYSSEYIIPQVDGSCDDLVPGCDLPEIVVNSERGRSSHRVQHKTNKSPTNDTKRKPSRLWGPLPFSSQQKVGDDSESSSFNSDDLSNVIKNSTSSSESCDVMVSDDNTNNCCLREQKEVVGTSVRDLMRRKRRRPVEPTDVGTDGVNNIEKKPETYFRPKKLEFQKEDNDMEDATLRRISRSPLVSDQAATTCERSPSGAIGVQGACPKAYEVVLGYGDVPTYGKLPLMSCGDSSCEGSTSSKNKHADHIEPSHRKLTIELADVSLLHSETKEVLKLPISAEHYTADGSGQPNCSKALNSYSFANHLMPSRESDSQHYTTGDQQSDVYSDNCEKLEAAKNVDVPQQTTTAKDVIHAKCIEMIFTEKPPEIEWKNWTSDDVHNKTSRMHKETTVGTLNIEGSEVDDYIPFFPDNVNDEDELHKPQESILGIPTHYQNDGSLFYLLTAKHVPPSRDSVQEWLLHNSPRCDAIGTSIQCITSECSESPSPCSTYSVDIWKEKPTQQPADMGCDDAIQRKIGNLYEEKTQHELTDNVNIRGLIRNDKVSIGNQQDVSQISGPYLRSRPTPVSQIGFRDPASVGEGQQLTLMSIEVHAESRGELRPDPRHDAITIIAITVQDDSDHNVVEFVLLRSKEGESNKRNIDGISGCTVIVALEEKHMLYHFMKIVRSSDPDILMGWEVQGSSLGFLAERATHLGVALLDRISRTPSCETKSPSEMPETHEAQGHDDLLTEAFVTDPTGFEDAVIDDEWGRTHASGLHVGGRIVLNLWRLMRGEIKLHMYTLEAVAEEVLRRKIPLIPTRILTQWFKSGPGRARYRCIEYITGRAKLNLDIINQLDLVNRTSELARVFGIDFFSVLSRGSQYRVESMFLRLAHTQNYVAISPGNQQVASQPAMECLPLVMEPESRFYADPVVVLDFQSLYPSMIIAYNLCFCTCLGKVIPAKANTLGASSFSPDPQLLLDLKNKLLLTPNGVMFVPSEVRKGILPRLLEEILSTRIMVKKAMKKLTSSQRVLHRIFNARQLALKLISNVTYGYTAAGFSGRMPCAELADSIVQCGRRTLETAISFVNSHEKWNARVVYGDTDSMFVLLKGRTMKEAFDIGHEIASIVTSMNPDPVTLKMEKVYHPCFLLTKKRYVGYSYETIDQTTPTFDAKGIETVRRDSCGAVAKTLEQSLRLFFEHQDTSKVKTYLQRQWSRTLAGRVSLQDFVFAKEVRLGTYSARSSSLPPAAIVATKAMRVDPRAEPRYAERIPYVVIHGEPGGRLADMVVDPMDVLAIESPFRLNDLYYINKQIIPALQRVFGLVGADLRQWFLEMPRPVRQNADKRFGYAPNGQRTRIDFYYLSRHCFLCGELVQGSYHLCEKCCKKESFVATAVCSKTSKLERDIQHLAAICRHCGGGDWIVESGVKCVSLSCPVFYERRKVQKELQTVSSVATEMGFYPRCNMDWF